MPSHAAAGDPRVRSNHDPRPLASQDDDIRKRQASRPPAGVDTPVIKKPKQTGESISSTNGNHARQLSVNIHDPHRSNVNSPAGSSLNPISLNTNGINDSSNGFKHPSGQTGFASPSGNMTGSGGSTPQSSTAPVAFMSSGAPPMAPPTDISFDLHASIFNALMGVLDQASELAVNKIALNEADIALRKVQREYNVAEKQFAMFPAIKEQKTAARTKTQKRFDEAQRSMQETKMKQQKIIGAAATTIASMQQSPITGIDQFLRNELADLRGMAGQGVEAQSRVAHLENKIASLTKRFDEALTHQQDSKAQQHTAEQLAALEQRVDEVRTLAQGAQSTASQQPPAVTDAAELAELKQRVVDVEKSQEDQVDVLAQHANEQVAQVSEWAKVEIQNLEGKVAEATAAQHATAQAIDECVGSVDSLRANFEENVSQGVSREVLGDFQRKVDALTVKVEILESRKEAPAAADMATATALDPSNPLGLVPFKPVIPKAKPTQPPPPTPTMKILEERPALGVNWNDWIESHIGALLQKTDHHEMRLNNTTTDTLYDAIMKIMKERYNKEYPDLMNWAGTVQEIRAAQQEFTAVQQEIKTVHDRDVGQLRFDVASLNLQVDAHRKAVVQGEQKFTEVANEVKAISQEVVQLQGAQQNALERALDSATS